MDSNFNNKVTQVVEIEDDVIDLDGDEKTPEEVIYEWDAKIRKKLSTFAVADNENILGDLMKEYFQSLQAMTRNYEDNETLKNKVARHISFLYLYYFELQCCTPDNYLNNMEDILTLYCNLELEVIRPLKKKDFSAHKYHKRIVSVSRQIINMLTVYLLERHDHILHVLMKMNTNNVSNSCSELLNVLYSHFLTKVPAFNLCDESFCRSYIVFQKWKEIRENEDWERMDKIMYKMFKRTPESVKNNENLRQILMPACQSTVDIVLNLFRSFRDISAAYFKHISAKKSIEMDDLDFNIDLGEDEPTIPCDDENEEEVSFLKAYYEVERNMSNLSKSNDIADIREVERVRTCKEEFDEDDDVQFIGITMLPKQPLLDLTVIDDEEASEKINNENENQRHIANETAVILPSISAPAIEKNPDLENLNGMTRICVGSPITVIESSSPCQTAEAQTTINPSSPLLCSIQEVISECNPPELNQPKVTLVSNDTQISTPEISNTVNETTLAKKTVEVKSVEVQADSIKNYVYNDYGLTTPPFDVPTDEQISRPVEPRLYTDIGQNREKELTPERENVCEKTEVRTRSVEVQVDAPSSGKDCPYNDYGLTPPNDSHLDDRGARLQETCLYANIVHKDLSDNKEKCAIDSQKISTHNVEVPQIEDVAQAGILPETESQVDDEFLSNTNKQDELDNCEHSTEHGSEYDELENELDISDVVTHIDAECDNEIETESCHTTDKDTLLTDETSNHEEVTEQSDTVSFEIRINPEFQIPQESFGVFKTSDQIDTGQKLILNTAPNIEPVMDADSAETKDLVSDTTYNGNTVLKPLSSNRTNGQARDVTSSPAKIMYTSEKKIRAASLDDFSRFESAIHTQWSKMKENHDFDDILSGPVSKIMPTKHNNILSSQDKLDIFGSQESNSKPIANTNSRSNSPNDMTSPAYEAIDDFKNYFSDSVNGRVPPPHDVKVPQGILKKTNSTRRKNYRIMFHESTCDKSEERRPHSDGVLVPKRIRRDRKLNMVPRVVVEQLPFIEEEIEKVLNNPGTLRVDYDKTTNHISEKDVVRCISPPKLSWIVNLSSSKHNPGKVKPHIDVSTLCEKNKSSCCDQLAEEFTKLNCNVVEDDTLILSIPNVVPASTPVDPETEFSNSPTFLPDTDELVQHCLEETSVETTPDIINLNASLLCDNSNFYTSQTCVTEPEDLGHNLSKLSKNAIKPELAVISNLKDDKNPESDLIVKAAVDDTLLTLPTAVPETYDFEKNLKNEVFSKIDLQSLDDSDGETRLPLKKRKLSVTNKNENLTEEQKKEEISYPATPMISIAEVEALHPMKLQANNTRPFKTPAERKEMPPLPVFYNVDSDPSPIITDQFNINNHTYNNPTINYHMNNVPVPFINIPCGSYYSLPPILVPFNNMSTFEQSKINPQQQENYTKKENRKQGRQRKRR